MEKEIKTNSLKAWFLAARPKTLAGAAVPVMIGIALAFKDTMRFKDTTFIIEPDIVMTGVEGEKFYLDGVFNWIPALLCLFFAWIMQIDSNLVNDYFDCLHGNDKEGRLGPKRACTEGWITMRAMRIGIIITTCLGCMTGLPLIYYGGIELIWVGVACVIFCFLYTTKLSYMGLGDLLVVMFFGFVPVCCTYYVLMPPPININLDVVPAAGLACGLVVDTLLVLNNFRDRENDKRVDKRTLVVRIGARKSAKLYLYLGLVGAGLMSIVNIVDFVKNKMYLPAFLLFGVYCYFHYKAYRKMVEIQRGKKLNMVLGMTSRNILIFGIISLITILLVIPFLQYPVVNYD